MKEHSTVFHFVLALELSPRPSWLIHSYYVELNKEEMVLIMNLEQSVMLMMGIKMNT